MGDFDIPAFDLNNDDIGSSNFGGGLELLMNDRVKEGGGVKSDIDLEDLNNLENELNDLVNDVPENSFSSKPSVSFDDSSFKINKESINLGQSTSQTESDNKTWDGYGKFNNIPLNPDKTVPTEPKMTKEELLREKFKFLRKLEALEKKGVELSKKYTMDSPLQEMQGEYETIMEEKASRIP